jgi:hypothetical protein
LEDLDRCLKDWKDIYQGLPREIGKTVSRCTQKDWKDTYQGLPRQIGKTLSRSTQNLDRVFPIRLGKP